MTTIKESKRAAQIERETKETKIRLSLCADAEKPGLRGSSGIGFFDHMLNSYCVHGGSAMELRCVGDLDVDCHHTVEDIGILLGRAYREVLRGPDGEPDFTGLARFGDACVPMDEALAHCAADFSGRAYLHLEAQFISPMIGGFDPQTVGEFFRALSFHIPMTLHLRVLYGMNDHHKCEALFKAAARAVSQALSPRCGAVLSAKGGF